MAMINPRYPSNRAPDDHRLLDVTRAAAVCGFKPATLLALAECRRGPIPYLIEEDGTPLAWTTEGIYIWRQMCKARDRQAQQKAAA
ncbi:MAG: hypothetical protein Q8N19_12750 [Phenylobacterium sp.]|uniref:hypothetical protein n=1 Tax=Phenylobacterium sp. TaxID=1871053 RepID=UPI0027349A7C|nr:hypothetical protein [Phenylobacterium sp.]MDP3117970.1 hypothetical protein [Phenylobacterium sp.]